MTKDIHITHITQKFKEVHGGGEPVLINLFNELAKLGYQNTVHTANIPEIMQQKLDERVEVKSLGSLFRKKSRHFLLEGIVDFMASFLLLVNIKRKTDILCFHTEQVVPALFLYKILFGRKKCLYFCFQPPRFAYDASDSIKKSSGFIGKLLPMFSAIYRPFDKLAVRKAQKVLSFSSDYKKWIESIYEIKDVIVLPPGTTRPKVLPSLPEDIVKQLQQPGVKTIIFVGKVIPQKNVNRLIQVTSILKNSIPEIKCLIIGDGPSLASVKSLITELALEKNVICPGYVFNDQLYSYYASADLFVNLEKNISFGLSIVEAQSCSLPALTFSGGGPSDIITHGKDGFLMPINATDEELAQQIVAYLKDESMMQKMREYAELNAQKYSWQEFARKFGEIVRKMIRGN